ncbi:hypothetical protein PPROV_000863300 [Pycnococcus provasolii]|uniref:Uncharacterized protein n=1 Tax=Pycnococcus provasolii TaxID=41880 RepID=A0A830HSE3_9CHLO|nr:hypothetical protein PPROV_000863300 [Pycnococcus provasolii]
MPLVRTALTASIRRTFQASPGVAGAGWRRRRHQGVELGSAPTNNDVEETAAAFVDEVCVCNFESSTAPGRQQPHVTTSGHNHVRGSTALPTPTVPPRCTPTGGGDYGDITITTTTTTTTGEHRDDDLPTGVDDVRCIHGRDLRIITLTNASSLVDTLTNLTKLAAISGSLLMDISDGSDANLSDVNDRPRVAGGTEESCGFG